MEVALPVCSANEPAIHRLVDDILEYIFLLNATHLSDLDSEDPPSVEFQLEHATTVASSKVCTRWRSIALNCHTIWGLIIDYRRHSLKWIETLLDRSSPSLLDFGSRIKSVYLTDLADDGQGALELVFNRIDRLRIFNLYAPDSCWELVRSRFFQLQAPNLEFAHVFFIHMGGHLTHPLFDNHAPNLQNLRLLRCSVDFTSPVLTPLTELYVHTIAQENALPVSDWLNILGRMPSLRWVTLVGAISGAPANDISQVIHLGALDMLSVDGPFHECVALVKNLIMPPRCGLRLRCNDAHLGFDQRQLWAIIEKKMDSWAKNAPNRHLIATGLYGFIAIGNLLRGSFGDKSEWATEEREVNRRQNQGLLDPVMTIKLYLSNPQDSTLLFLSLLALFERTFFNTTYLQLWINYDDEEAEVFLSLVDSFRGFVNLEKLYLVHQSLVKSLFPLLQQANLVLLPVLKSLYFYGVTFGRSSDPILGLADFLQWRREQGFPVQKIGIVSYRHRISRKFVLRHIQDTVVEMDD